MPLPGIRVEIIRVEDLSLKLLDRKVGDKWTAGLKLDLVVDDLQLKDILKQNIAMGNAGLIVSGVKVDQPTGFGKTSLLTVDKVELATSGVDLASSRLPVDKVLLDHLVVELARNAEGESNVQQIMEAWITDKAGDAPQQKSADMQPAGAGTRTSSPVVPALAIEDIQLKRISLTLLDSIDDKPWQAGFKELDLNVSGLVLENIAEKAVSLNSFALDLKDVAVDQPPGFGDDKLAGLKHLAVKSDRLDTVSKKMVVKQILVDTPVSFVTINSDGSSNLKILAQALAGEKKGGRAASPENENSDNETKNPTPEKKALPLVLFEKIKIKDGSIKLRDKVSAEEVLSFTLQNIQADVSQLRLFDTNSTSEPASASMSFELEQSGDLPTGYFGSLASIGPVESGIPQLNSQARLTGLKLDSLGSMIPPGTRTSLGARGLDASVALSMNDKMIDLNTSVLTDKNVHYDEIKVHGSLDAPKIELGAILAGAFNRVGKGVFNVGKQGVTAGVEIAKGGAKAVKEVGIGALDITKNMGKGIAGAGAGLITADKEKIKKGVVETTKGTVDKAAYTVGDTGKAAGKGLKSSASDLKGDAIVAKWDQGISARHKAAMQKADKALEKMHYPPVFD